MNQTVAQVENVIAQRYKAGFYTDIDSDRTPLGLNEEIIAMISAKKNEPTWMLEWRLKAFHHWQSMPTPDWAHLNVPAIDFQKIYYYSAPKQKDRPKSLDEVDPKLLETFDKLGVPLHERARLAGPLPKSKTLLPSATKQGFIRTLTPTKPRWGSTKKSSR